MAETQSQCNLEYLYIYTPTPWITSPLLLLQKLFKVLKSVSSRVRLFLNQNGQNDVDEYRFYCKNIWCCSTCCILVYSQLSISLSLLSISILLLLNIEAEFVYKNRIKKQNVEAWNSENPADRNFQELD